MHNKEREKYICHIKPIAHLINPSKYQKYLCNICFQLPLRPVRCIHCKKCLCTQCCIDQKVANNKCPFRCGGQLQLQRALEVQYTFSCPYSNECKHQIKSIRQFYSHDQDCSKISKRDKQISSKKWSYQCDKGHVLMLDSSLFDLIVSRRKCSICQQITVCRSVCKKCDQIFCYSCKPFPMTKNRCPQGHYLIKREVKEQQQYRCDICQLFPKMIGVQVFDDIKCNYGICEMCMESMIIFQKPQPILEYDPTYCQKVCLHNPFSQQKVKHNQHRLQVIFRKNETCQSCLKKTICVKFCEKCNQAYCPSCKPILISWQNKCEFNHHIEERTSELPIICYKCTQPVQPGTYYFYDRLCKTIFCFPCSRVLINIFQCLILRKGLANIGKCHKGHEIDLMPGTAIKQKCSRCQMQKNILLYCSFCEEKDNLFCCLCFQPPLPYCYCHKQLQNILKNEQCMICDKQSQLLQGCERCGIKICSKCN